MFYIIEKKTQLEKLQNLGNIFLNVIPNNNNYHPKLQTISLIYIRSIGEKKGYIFCINHNESDSLNFYDFECWLALKTNKIFVIDKKKYVYYFNYIHSQIYNIYLKKDIIVDKCIDFLYHHLFSHYLLLFPIYLCLSNPNEHKRLILSRLSV